MKLEYFWYKHNLTWIEVNDQHRIRNESNQKKKIGKKLKFTFELGLILGWKMLVNFCNHNCKSLFWQTLQINLFSAKFILNFRIRNGSYWHKCRPPFVPLHEHFCCFISVHWSCNQEPHQRGVSILLLLMKCSKMNKNWILQKRGNAKRGKALKLPL